MCALPPVLVKPPLDFRFVCSTSSFFLLQASPTQRLILNPLPPVLFLFHVSQLAVFLQMAYKDVKAYAKNFGTRIIDVEKELKLRTGENKYTLKLTFFDKLGGVEPFRNIIQQCIDKPEMMVRRWLEERGYHEALQYCDAQLSDLPEDLKTEYPVIVDPPLRPEGPKLPRPSAVAPCAQGRNEKCQGKAASCKRKRSVVECQNDHHELPNASNAVKEEPTAVEAAHVGRQVNLRINLIDPVVGAIIIGDLDMCFIDDWFGIFHPDIAAVMDVRLLDDLLGPNEDCNEESVDLDLSDAREANLKDA